MKFQRSHYVPEPYRIASVGGRVLQIPKAEDRQLQREIYDQVKHLCPVQWRPEQIQQRIREALATGTKKMANASSSPASAEARIPCDQSMVPGDAGARPAGCARGCTSSGVARGSSGASAGSRAAETRI